MSKCLHIEQHSAQVTLSVEERWAGRNREGCPHCRGFVVACEASRGLRALQAGSQESLRHRGGEQTSRQV